MKRICLIIFIGIVLLLMAPYASSENFPAFGSSHQPQTVAPSQAQQKLFYGYVPPTPILHTWPGGYRVIFNEMLNTLAEHLLGQY